MSTILQKFNAGTFEGNKYIKRVNFSKAVLWKDRQISLNTSVTSQFKSRGTELIIFEDERKNERWTASVSELRAVAVLKTEGQEKQFYFPISAFKVSKIHKEEKQIPVKVVSQEAQQQTFL